MDEAQLWLFESVDNPDPEEGIYLVPYSLRKGRDRGRYTCDRCGRMWRGVAALLDRLAVGAHVV